MFSGNFLIEILHGLSELKLRFSPIPFGITNNYFFANPRSLRLKTASFDAPRLRKCSNRNKINWRTRQKIITSNIRFFNRNLLWWLGDHKLFIKSLKYCLLIRYWPPISIAFKLPPGRILKCQLYGARERKFKVRAATILTLTAFLTGANYIWSK
jgi:hypothetical protein